MNKMDLITAEREVIESKFQLMIDNFEIKTSKRNYYTVERYCRYLVRLMQSIELIHSLSIDACLTIGDYEEAFKQHIDNFFTNLRKSFKGTIDRLAINEQLIESNQKIQEVQCLNTDLTKMTQLIKSLNQYSTTVLESNLHDDKTVKSIDTIIDNASNLSIPTNSGKKHNSTSLHKRPLHESTTGGVTTPQVKEAKMKSFAPEQQQEQHQEEGGDRHHPMKVVHDSSTLPRVNKITPKMNPNKNWKENYQQQAIQRN